MAEKQLENKIKDLENKNKKLFDEKCRYELQNRELIAKVGVMNPWFLSCAPFSFYFIFVL